jgi:diacylglycerol kinase family enzyme
MRKPKWYQIPHLILFLKNKRKKSPLITYYQANKITIEQGIETWHIDGEPIQLKGRKVVQSIP